MKKAFYVLLASFSISAILSCTPEAVESIEKPQQCCGDDFQSPPPPIDG